MLAEDTSAELAEQVRGRVEADREAIVDLCRRLVQAPSVNPPGDTRQVAEIVAAELRERGLVAEIHRQHPAMPSVVAELDSGRPGPHLVLNVHQDTMPPGDTGAWTVPVHELTRRAGRLYGLGMGNMKGAVAAMIFAVGYLADLHEHWTGRITFTAVSDEVVFGDNGAAYLLREHPSLYGDGLLCGEGPGFDRLAVGEKGVLWLALTTTGAGGHSSATRPGASAGARLARAVVQVDAISGHAGTLPPELAALTGASLADELTLTANVGRMEAGSFIGQIPTTGRAEVDLRLPPGLPANDAEALVTRAVEGLEVDVARIKGWDPNWTDPRNPLVVAFQDVHTRLLREPARYAVRLPASDASRWRARDVPALCYGPQPTLSAGVDDYAEEEAVLRCAALYALTSVRFCGSVTR